MSGLETPTLPEAESEPSPETELDLETVKQIVRVSHDAIETLLKKLNVLQPDASLPAFPEAQLLLNDKTDGPMANHHGTTGVLELRKNLTLENAIISVLHELVHYYAVNVIAFARTEDSAGNIESSGHIKTGFHVHNKRADNIGHEHLRSFNEAIVHTTTIALLKAMEEVLSKEFPELNREEMIATAERIYARDRVILHTVVNKIIERDTLETETSTHISEQAVWNDIMTAQFTGKTFPITRKIEAVCGKGALRIIGAGRAIQKVGEDQSINNVQLDAIAAFLETDSQAEKDGLAKKILGSFEYYQYILQVHIRGIRQALKDGSAEDWSMPKIRDAQVHINHALDVAELAFIAKFDHQAQELLEDNDVSNSKRELLLASAGYSPNANLEQIADYNNPPASIEQQIKFLTDLLLREQTSSLLEMKTTLNELLQK